MASPFTTPVILTGSAVANPGSDAAIPATSLANPLGLPIELLEIRARLWVDHSASTWDSTTPSVAAGSSVGLKMSMGKVEIINGYTPIGTLSSARQAHGDVIPNAPLSYLASRANASPPTIFQFRLKYPLLMPVGAAPVISIRPRGQNAYPVRVDLALIARTWNTSKPLPKTTKVPWVTSYSSETVDFQAGTVAQASDVSGDLDLVNPFDQEIEIARLGSSLAMMYSDSTSYSAIGEEAAQFRYNSGRFTLRSSRGFDIVRTPTPFGGLFPFSWRVWDMAKPWYMTPREFYTMTMQVDASTFTSPANVQFQYNVGLIGYRSIPVAALS